MANRQTKNENTLFAERYIQRIQRDTAELLKSPPHGIFALPDEEDMKLVDVMMVGPEGTPYQGGLFHFLVDFTSNYPQRPPRVKLLTTGNNAVMFNPQFYPDGTVCLSIFGNYNKQQQWTPKLNLSGVCLSIQSLMNGTPYCVEPTLNKNKNREIIEKYNRIIQHETIRVAVCDSYEDRYSYPKQFRQIIEKTVRENYHYYVDVCLANANHDGNSLRERFCGSAGVFRFEELLQRLESYKLR